MFSFPTSVQNRHLSAVFGFGGCSWFRLLSCPAVELLGYCLWDYLLVLYHVKTSNKSLVRPHLILVSRVPQDFYSNLAQTVQLKRLYQAAIELEWGRPVIEITSQWSGLWSNSGARAFTSLSESRFPDVDVSWDVNTSHYIRQSLNLAWRKKSLWHFESILQAYALSLCNFNFVFQVSLLKALSLKALTLERNIHFSDLIGSCFLCWKNINSFVHNGINGRRDTKT